VKGFGLSSELRTLLLLLVLGAAATAAGFFVGAWGPMLLTK
jgi:hypothetical protein